MITSSGAAIASSEAASSKNSAQESQSANSSQDVVNSSDLPKIIGSTCFYDIILGDTVKNSFGIQGHSGA
jgi:hypothetical protein